MRRRLLFTVKRAGRPLYQRLTREIETPLQEVQWQEEFKQVLADLEAKHKDLQSFVEDVEVTR